MTTTKFQNLKVSSPARMLIRPMLFAAIGLHALLLFTPLPSEQKPKTPDDKKDPVKITQIPTSNKPAAKAQKLAKPALPKINRPRTNSPTRSAIVPPQTAQSAATASPSTKASASNAKNPFQDFPHFQPSTPDCFGKGLGENCRIASAGLTAVASFYESEPAKKKFTVDKVENGADKKIYQVSKNGQSLYLNLLTDGPTTVVVLSPEKIADLQALKGAVVPPTAYYELLGTFLATNDRADEVPASIANPDQFEQPDFFYKSQTKEDALNGTIRETLPGFDSANVALGLAPAAFYTTNLEPDLKPIFDEEVSKVGQYGGGDLYKLKNKSVTIYMSLVPVKGQAGTIIVTWLKDPR